MVRKIAMFNHKGGVGKTTLTINLADAFAQLGHRVLMVDADPQCNLSAFCLPEAQLDAALGASSEDDGMVDEDLSDEETLIDDTEGEGDTLWTGIRSVVRGRGDVQRIKLWPVQDNVLLAVGDVLLSLYEEELPAAWTDSFARKTRGYDVMCALPRLVDQLANENDIDLVLYDVGPNVGPLNRTVVLDADYLITPVAPDLFSLRALSTVGHAIARWISDWETVRSIASTSEHGRLLRGRPVYLGYIISGFKVRKAGEPAEAHQRWERKIAPRVRRRVVQVLTEIDPKLVVPPPYKLGQVKHFQSLAVQAQDKQVPFAGLRGLVNSGYNHEVATAAAIFRGVAERVLDRMATNG